MGSENLEYHNSPKFSDTQNVCCNHLIIEPRCEKTGLRGFRPGPTQTPLHSHRRSLEPLNFGFRK